MQQSKQVLIHISGPDRSGVTASLCQVLSENNSTLVDIGQTVLHGHLALSAIVEIPPGSDTLHKLLERVSQQGLRLELGDLQTSAANTSKINTSGLCVTLMGQLSRSAALAACTDYLAAKGMNIREIKALSCDALSGVEIIAETQGSTLADQNFQELRGDLYSLAAKLSVDISAQRENVFRRNKRLICMDVDSTFVPEECIDLLGELHGCGEEIAKVTAKAMNGEINFEQALRERVSKLQGLSVEKAEKRMAEVNPLPETQKMLKAFRNLGLKVGVVSGGFHFFVDKLKSTYMLDFAFANRLTVKNGVFTGELEGEIITPAKKAEVLSHMAQAYECPLPQTVAVGDGANDIPMLKTAGLGIAFRAKRSVQEQADTRLNCSALESILYLLGYKQSEIRDLL